MAANQDMTALGYWDSKIPCGTCTKSFHAQKAASHHMNDLGHQHPKITCQTCEMKFTPRMFDLCHHSPRAGFTVVRSASMPFQHMGRSLSQEGRLTYCVSQQGPNLGNPADEDGWGLNRARSADSRWGPTMVTFQAACLIHSSHSVHFSTFRHRPAYYSTPFRSQSSVMTETLSEDYIRYRPTWCIPLHN